MAKSMRNKTNLCAQTEPYNNRGRIHPNQTVIYHQGDEVTGFYRVNSGIVMVYRLLENSQRQIAGFFTQGDYFGLTSGDRYHDTAVTVSTANIMRLTMSDVRNSPELQKEVFEVTCGQLDAAQKLITTLTKKTASEKVATFLTMLAERQHRGGEEFDIRLPMSRLDIADYLGLSIETVSRRLSALRQQKIVTFPNRNTVHICQFSKLEHMARVH
jgi:CRP-like cAMP-binding protein